MTNAGGGWVFLDDFQAVKLSDTLENASINDTDYDGISDGNKDYDGEIITPDSAPRNNTFTGKMYWDVGDKPKESKQDIKFTVDYSSLFKNNSDYNKNLSVLTSLYTADIYDESYLNVATGASGGSDDPTALGKLFGLKDVEDIKINGTDYAVDTDDSSEFVIGHRSVTYKGSNKEIIVVIVRGTNGTNAEWSSNFDVGADADEYYAAIGASHPDWKNKGNHKGFDVVSNRILTKIDDYLSRHSLTSGSRVMLITGHSRGGAIANLLGAHYERNANIASYTYTFAAPNPTTDENHGNYKTIFNIRNTDDVITYLPIGSWGFYKYGVLKEVSVETQCENKWGGRQEGTWEWLTGEDYNNDGGTQRTLEAFRKIATTRDDIYVLDSSTDGKVWENNVGHTTLAGAEKELETLTNSLRKEKLLKYCNLSIVGGTMTPYHVEINYSPAYLMQMLSNMTTKKKNDVGRPQLGRDVKGKYAEAKASFMIIETHLIVKYLRFLQSII